MSRNKSNVIPGDIIFKLYDTHGFPEEVIQRVATLNNLTLDNQGFWKLLAQHKARHKTALKEQSSNRGILFNDAIETLIKNGVNPTNDAHKYAYKMADLDDTIIFEPLKTKIVAILNEDCDWIDISDPSENRAYYLVTEDTNFYCEEGGQIADTGVVTCKNNVIFNVNSVFKIRDYVFHKGTFTLNNSGENYVKCGSDVTLNIDSEKRLKIMQNHTGVHLLNAAIRKVLPNSVIGQVGSYVSDKGLSMSLCIYGEKLSQEKILKAQELIR